MPHLVDRAATLRTDPTGTNASTSPDPNDAANDATVYRFFGSRTGTQSLTSSTAERDAVIATRPDLVPEGIAFHALTDPT